MQVELNHADLCHLVCGTNPPRQAIQGLVRLGLGSYSGSHDRWDWNQYSESPHVTNQAWHLMSEQQLWAMYKHFIQP